MIDLDRTRLDRVLPASPRPGDWDDVVQRAGALERRRRRELILVLAVAAIVVAGTAFASGLYDRILSSGSTSLPPEGAPASAPAAGRLLITYDGRPELRGFPGRFVPTHQVWVYADGRVIWRRETGPVGVQGAAGEVRTGYSSAASRARASSSYVGGSLRPVCSMRICISGTHTIWCGARSASETAAGSSGCTGAATSPPSFLRRFRMSLHWQPRGKRG